MIFSDLLADYFGKMAYRRKILDDFSLRMKIITGLFKHTFHFSDFPQKNDRIHHFYWAALLRNGNPKISHAIFGVSNRYSAEYISCLLLLLLPTSVYTNMLFLS